MSTHKHIYTHMLKSQNKVTEPQSANAHPFYNWAIHEPYFQLAFVLLCSIME